MPRPPLMRKPMRFHLALEKETVDKLRKIAEADGTTITEILRKLAEDLVLGTLRSSASSLDDVVRQIQRARAKRRPIRSLSTKMVRQLRDSGA